MRLSIFAIPAVCTGLFAAAASLAAGEGAVTGPGQYDALKSAPLRTVESFNSIADPTQRSVALFTEASKVITHPRCLNCHPADGRPTQGDDMHPHTPPMWGGPEGHGVKGLACSACHTAANFQTGGLPPTSTPGDPKWALAPAEMAWQGKTPAQICAQLKDPARNGGRDLAALHEHMAQDHLVGWGWNPGPGRTPAPGTQAQFGALIKAWIDTGAACPT